MNILHVLYTSIPDHTGSSIRSRGLVSSQKKIALNPIAITSPFQKPIVDGCEVEVIEGVPHFRTWSENEQLVVSELGSSLINKVKKAMQIFHFRKQALKIARQENIDVVHAHSIFFCGLAGAYVGRKLAIPFVYEVRSLWEERRWIDNPTLLSFVLVKLFRFFEIRVMKSADHVVVINKELKENLVFRGLLDSKISIIDNAVENSSIEIGKANAWPKNKQSDFVFAYIGSVSPIEGLELLLSAWKSFFAKYRAHELRIYGGGISLEKLRGIIVADEIQGVKLMGSFMPSDAKEIYEGVDVVINPRYKSRLSDIVTPLKPLEAMAYHKLVLSSDVGGMRALFVHGVTGLQFLSDDERALTDSLEYIIGEDINVLSKIVDNGYQYVSTERTWESNAQKYKQLYLSLGE